MVPRTYFGFGIIRNTSESLIDSMASIFWWVKVSQVVLVGRAVNHALQIFGLHGEKVTGYSFARLSLFQRQVVSPMPALFENARRRTDQARLGRAKMKSTSGHGAFVARNAAQE